MTASLNAPVCVQLISVVESMLVSTDVPEADHSAIANATLYTQLVSRVISTATHKIYECILTYTSATPAIAPDLDTTHWQEVSATNRWKVFDNSNSSQTAQATSMSYRLTPGEVVSDLSVQNISNATAVRVRLVDPTFGTVYDLSADVSPPPSAPGWWEWTFGLRTAPVSATFRNLPAYPEADLLVDIEGGDDLAIGWILFGQAYPLGIGLRTGAQIGIQDYSRIQTNEFGDTVLVQRAFAKRAKWDLVIQREDVDATLDFLASKRATVCLWIGSSFYESSVLCGIYKDLGGVIAYAKVSEVSIQLQGMT